jgi:hypothetical protein
LIVGDDENGLLQGGGDHRPPPSREIGEELRRFFLELLEGDNLRRYQGDGREEYINERRSGLSDDAQRLISSGDLREIEGHIAEITGSRAVIVYVVCPPF